MGHGLGAGVTVEILPFVLYGLVVAAVSGVTLAASWFIGDRSRHAGARDIPFESRRAMRRTCAFPSSST